jgi:hypothetical protein
MVDSLSEFSSGREGFEESDYGIAAHCLFHALQLCAAS